MSVKQRIRQRWQRWLDRRIPPASQVTLSHRSIFILPTATGALYLLMLVVMLILILILKLSLMLLTDDDIALEDAERLYRF